MATLNLPVKIRLATEDDSEQIAEIYAPIVRETWISFETEVPTTDQFRQRINKIGVSYPWLVCVRGNDVMGYVYASQHAERAAYMWSANVTVYIKGCYRRFGIGRLLYGTLFDSLRMLGYFNAFAGVTLPNAGSVGLHESLGFQKVSHYKNTGFKFGQWLDVGWWQLQLQSLHDKPTPPRSIADIAGTSQFNAALETHSALLNQRFHFQTTQISN
jgi:phosphinothricin acetyltransferase